MDDERTDLGGGMTLVGATADVAKMGALVRELIEGLGGVPAFDDRTMGVLSSVQHARNFQYYFNSQHALVRLMRGTCAGGRASH
jgi:hypothetical protein